MKKRILACLLLAAFLLPVLVACPSPDNGGGTTTPEATTPGATTPGATTPGGSGTTGGGDPSQPGSEPVDWDPTPDSLTTAKKYPYVDEVTGTLYMTYQSSYTFETALAGDPADVVITSKKTGTDTKDEALLTVSADGRTVTSVGTGSCTVALGAETVKIEIVPAPMNLLFVTGQSNAAAEPGSDHGPTSDFYQNFVRSEEGKAYYTHLAADISIAEGATKSPDKYVPNNLVWSTCRTNSLGNDPRVLSSLKTGATAGSGWGGLARVWTEETGEYVWIVNSSFGGMPIKTFQPSKDGTVEDNNYYRSLTAFRLALETLYREVDAGHFVLNHMAYYWCQGEADFRTRTAKEYYEDFLNVHNGYMRDLVYDHAGVKKTLEYCGINIIRSCYDIDSNAYTELHLTGPRLMQYYAAGMASGALSNVYVVSNVTERWVGDDQKVVDYFTETYGSAEAFLAYFGYEMPTTREQLHPNIHYNVRGYNEISMEAGRNSLRLLTLISPDNCYKTSLSMHTVKPELTLLGINGYTAYTDTLWLDADTESSVVFPKLDPVYRMAEGLTVTTSTPGFHVDMYTLYRDDKTANAVELTVSLGGKTLAVFSFEVKRMGSFSYNMPNAVNHGTIGESGYEYLGASGSWTPGVYDAVAKSFEPSSKFQTGYAWLLTQNQSLWYTGAGGFGGSQGYLYATPVVGAEASKYLALAYTVDCNATVKFGASDFSNNVGSALLAVYINGTRVFPRTGSSTNEADWYTLDNSVSLESLNEALGARSFDVKTGDTIYFAVRTPSTASGSAQTILHPVVYYQKEK